MARIVGLVMWILVAITYAWKIILPIMITFAVLVVVGVIQEQIKSRK